MTPLERLSPRRPPNNRHRAGTLAPPAPAPHGWVAEAMADLIRDMHAAAALARPDPRLSKPLPREGE